jgi:hypothetical protein
MAAHILRDQLEVTDAEFWACVNDRQLPSRARPTPPAETIPANLLRILKTELKLDETQLKNLTRADAITLAANYWSGQFE